MRELTATINVRGRGRPSAFERRDRATNIDGLDFIDTNGCTHRFEEALYDTYADGYFSAVSRAHRI